MRVIVPYDGSPQAEAALEYAVEHHAGGDIVLLYVLDFIDASYELSPKAELPGYWSEWYENSQEAAEEKFEQAREAVDHELESETVLGRPAQAIVEYVEEADADAVVMGSHGREGVSRILLGSVAETVVRRSPVPVTVVR